ncbi:MAG: hypothetical protein C0605_10615 [Hyphomicrobiales bacterium]|nr:MAG: hypothetical protein C0605_10615 [Hyphomicrobiales bacterium]
MLIVLTICLLGLCCYSLISAYMSWQAVRSGPVHIDVLRDLTGVVDRDDLNARFGSPAPGLFYQVSAAAVRRARGPASWLLSNEVLDAVMLGLLAYSLFAGAETCRLCILVLSGLYLLLGYGLGFYLIFSHLDQIQEEI